MKHLLPLLIVLFLASCASNGNNQEAKETEDTNTVTTKEDQLKAELAKMQQWNYESKTDEMTDEISHFARIVSKNQVQLEYPYQGGTGLMIVLGKSKNASQFMLTIVNGRFDTDSYSVEMRFDEEPLNKYSGTLNNQTFIIEATDELISKLKKSKQLKLRVPLNVSGDNVFNFDIEGFTWNY